MFAIWSWFTGSRVGQWIGIAIAAFVAVLVVLGQAKRAGRKEAEARGAKDALDAIIKQRRAKDEVVDRIRHGDGYDELRDRWTRE